MQALRTATDTVTESFTYTLSDTDGATSTTTLAITIQGTNDAPVAVADTGVAVEAGGVLNATGGSDATGNVLANDTDVDAGDTKTVSAVGGVAGNVGSVVVGTYGSITLAADGSYTYVVDNTNATVQALRTSAQTVNESFTYTMRDTAGATSSTTLTITIQGANDAPVAVADVSTAVEAGGVANATGGSDAVGNVLANDTDVDAGDTKTVSAVGGWRATWAAWWWGTYGSITLNADGSYTYVVDNTNSTVQGAAHGDGHGDRELHLHAERHGRGDEHDDAGDHDPGHQRCAGGGGRHGRWRWKPAGAQCHGRLDATGNVLANDTDVDAGDTKTVSAVGGVAGNVGSVVVGTYGSITLNADGSYTYVVDNTNSTVQALRTATDTVTESFTYTLSDTDGATSTTTLAITIQGTNDAPVAVADTGVAVEAGGVLNATGGSDATGNVLANDTDVDAGDTKTVSAVGGVAGNVGSVVVGTYGSITLNADGSYTYVVDNTNSTVQALRTATDTVTESFTYTLSDTDGATSTTTLAITIQGTNDAPVAVADTGVAVEAGGVLNATGGSDATGNVLANDTDVDAGDTKTVSAVGGGGRRGQRGGGDVRFDHAERQWQLHLRGGQHEHDGAGAAHDERHGERELHLHAERHGRGDLEHDDADDHDPGRQRCAGGGGRRGGGSRRGGQCDGRLECDGQRAGQRHRCGCRGHQDGERGGRGGGQRGQRGGGDVRFDHAERRWQLTYVVDNTNSTVQALRTATDTVTESFTYTLSDTDGATSTTTLAITIQGTNDAPVAVADTGVAVEAGGCSMPRAARMRRATCRERHRCGCG